MPGLRWNFGLRLIGEFPFSRLLTMLDTVIVNGGLVEGQGINDTVTHACSNKSSCEVWKGKEGLGVLRIGSRTYIPDM